MKATSIILIILYFVAFILGGYFFYTRYYKKIISPEVSKPVENKTEYIYYSSDNNLYQLNPGILKQSPKDITNIRLQSTGQVSNMVVAKEEGLFFYDSLTPENTWEIWKVSLKDNSSEKLFSSQTPGLENFQNFRNPQISKDNQKLAFIATHNTDNLFYYDLKNTSLINLTGQLFQGNIGSFSWSPDSKKLFFSSSTEDLGAIYQVDTNKKLEKLWEGQGKINKIIAVKDKIIFSQQEKNSDDANINLNILALSDNKKQAITDLSFPKQAANFETTINGDYIVLETKDKSQAKSDLYLLKNDGTNLLQLTDDGLSSQAVFSPDGSKIAFWVQGDGIYIMNINKSQRQKILNNQESIYKILIWS